MAPMKSPVRPESQSRTNRQVQQQKQPKIMQQQENATFGDKLVKDSQGVSNGALIHEINTQAVGVLQEEQYPGRPKENSYPSNKSEARIEVIEWSHEDQGGEQNSEASSVSLKKLMMGQAANPRKVAAKDEKLTIDNLWKILACEKPTTQEEFL